MDPFGLSAERGTPTPLEAAYMARNAYGNLDSYNRNLNKNSEDWIFYKTLVDGDTLKIIDSFSIGFARWCYHYGICSIF